MSLPAVQGLTVRARSNASPSVSTLSDDSQSIKYPFLGAPLTSCTSMMLLTLMSRCILEALSDASRMAEGDMIRHVHTVSERRPHTVKCVVSCAQKLLSSPHPLQAVADFAHYQAIVYMRGHCGFRFKSRASPRLLAVVIRLSMLYARHSMRCQPSRTIGSM